MKDVWEAHGEREPDKREVTALLVVPKGYREAMQLLSAYRKNRDVQMVFPSQSVISLYAMVGQTKHFWESSSPPFWRYLSSSRSSLCTGAAFPA